MSRTPAPAVRRRSHVGRLTPDRPESRGPRGRGQDVGPSCAAQSQRSASSHTEHTEHGAAGNERPLPACVLTSSSERCRSPMRLVYQQEDPRRARSTHTLGGNRGSLRAARSRNGAREREVPVHRKGSPYPGVTSGRRRATMRACRDDGVGGGFTMQLRRLERDPPRMGGCLVACTRTRPSRARPRICAGRGCQKIAGSSARKDRITIANY
jgi:hypothetical protein